MSEQTAADMDGGWKQMIEDYLEEFFRFFFPERDDILKLFRFMDYILRLPDDLASRVRSELESIEEKLSMPYVTSVERLARQEGIEQGVLQCSRDLLLQTIQIRFGQIPDPLRASINACTSTEQLSAFHRQALLANSLDDLPHQL